MALIISESSETGYSMSDSPHSSVSDSVGLLAFAALQLLFSYEV
jgi:hypothetical protein